MNVDAGSNPSAFPDNAVNLPPDQKELRPDTDALRVRLREKAAGGHLPITLYYTSLFEIQDKTDIIFGFDPKQDKIHLKELLLSLGEDMGLNNLKPRRTPEGDLQLWLDDGPAGVGGAHYHILTLRDFHTDTKMLHKVISAFVIV